MRRVYLLVGKKRYFKSHHVQKPGTTVSYCNREHIGEKTRPEEPDDLLCKQCLKSQKTFYRGYDVIYDYLSHGFEITQGGVKVSCLLLATRKAAENVIDTYLKSKENEILRSSR